LDQERKNLQSTKTNPPVLPSSKPATWTNIHICAIVPATAPCSIYPPTDKIYTDLTGKFPVQSTLGNKYILISYCVDANSILAEPIKDRTAGEIARAHQAVYTYLTTRGLKSQFEILDNECSADLIQVMQKNNIQFQLVPPHLHRANAAERAIRTWKNHFITILCGLDPRFPLQLWDKLLQQTNLTLNLLRPSRLNPRMSAEAMMNGPFDFNRTPIAPLGTKVLVHEKPAVRGTWAPHAIDGWYVGPARQHYRCYTVYIPSTKGTRHSETVEFFPYQLTMPVTSSSELAIKAAEDLTHILRNPAPASPFHKFGTETSIALAKLADIFSQLQPKVPTLKQLPQQQQSTKPIRAPLDFSAILPPSRPSRPTLDFSTILPPNPSPTLPRIPALMTHVPVPPPRVPASIHRQSLPLPRVPTSILTNQYTGSRQRGCNDAHIITKHRYPTRMSIRQTALVNLILPTSSPPHASTTYATAANILTIQNLSEDLTATINSVLDPTIGNSLEYNELFKRRNSQSLANLVRKWTWTPSKRRRRTNADRNKYHGVHTKT
jgi:hypothetical protein